MLVFCLWKTTCPTWSFSIDDRLFLPWSETVITFCYSCSPGEPQKIAGNSNKWSSVKEALLGVDCSFRFDICTMWGAFILEWVGQQSGESSSHRSNDKSCSERVLLCVYEKEMEGPWLIEVHPPNLLLWNPADWLGRFWDLLVVEEFWGVNNHTERKFWVGILRLLLFFSSVTSYVYLISRIKVLTKLCVKSYV